MKTQHKAITFSMSSDGDSFSAFRKAEGWLKENGYVVGSMCCDKPIGFAPADQYDWVAKWNNLTSSDISQLTGAIYVDGLGYRDADYVTIKFF